MKDFLINAEGISKSFGKDNRKRKILNSVDVGIKPGEFVCIMGPSGSGKSTLLFALSGMEEVDEGVVHFVGRDISKTSETESADIRRRDMGFVFQQATMLKNLNVLDNIILPSLNNKKDSKDEVLKKAYKLMKQTGIDHVAMNQITEVSGGELQRAGICRALMNSPKIVFGDEPTGALNSKTAKEILKILCNVHASGTSILLVTHDVRVAAHGERVLFIKDGLIASEQNFSGATDKSSELDKRSDILVEQMKRLQI